MFDVNGNHAQCSHDRLSHLDGSSLLKMEGDIDSYSVADLVAALENLHVDERVVVDMAGVRFMDSSGLNALLSYMLRLQGTRGTLCVVNPSPAVHRVVEITGRQPFL